MRATMVAMPAATAATIVPTERECDDDDVEGAVDDGIEVEVELMGGRGVDRPAIASDVEDEMISDGNKGDESVLEVDVSGLNVLETVDDDESDPELPVAASGSVSVLEVTSRQDVV